MDPGDPAAPKKYYPSVVASGRMSLELLCERIAYMSTVSSADTVAVIEALLTIIPQELAQGNVVELGDFGNFWLKNNARGEDTPEEIRASHITRVLPRFNPGKRFKQTLKEIEFKKA